MAVHERIAKPLLLGTIRLGEQGNGDVRFVGNDTKRYNLVTSLSLTCQCVYQSLELPCDTCRESNSADPCVKTWGPKKQREQSTVTRVSMFEVTDGEIVVQNEPRQDDIWLPVTQLTQSRPISNYDPSIDSAETHLLQRVYLNPSALDTLSVLELRLICQIACVYGPSICHSSLRRAVILFCLPIWSESMCANRLEEQRRQTRNALKCRVNDPAKLDEGDLLSVFLVARHYTLCASFGDGNYTEAQRHTKGFFSLINFLQSAQRSGKHFVLQSLWPLLAAYAVSQIDMVQGFVYIDWSCRAQTHTLLKAWEYLPSLRLLQFRFDRRQNIRVGMFYCFVALRSLYEVKWKHKGTDSLWDTDSTSCQVAVEATLNSYDQEYAFSRIDTFLAWQQWSDIGTRVLLLREIWGLFFHHLCRFLHGALFPPNESPQVLTQSRIVTATRFMEILRRLEMMVNRHIAVYPAPPDAILEGRKESRTGEGTSSVESLKLKL
jgi:hypothetical protein